MREGGENQVRQAVVWTKKRRERRVADPLEEDRKMTTVSQRPERDREHPEIRRGCDVRVRGDSNRTVANAAAENNGGEGEGRGGRTRYGLKKKKKKKKKKREIPFINAVFV
ncbi:hypothetical protein EYF80_004973 [Liparis tanakae]|uniref:Uncharacterized protein n=1 Tax=Liparis tanakae TaxID=230148 RepID=A0A4Z2J5J7_9TELE|nr:hypothetical protein EYF80_004973 [Liparis tanakae]